MKSANRSLFFTAIIVYLILKPKKGVQVRLMTRGLCIFALFWGLSGCDFQLAPPAPPKTAIDYKDIAVRLDEGAGIISDDYYITNNSPYDLEDVNVSCTAYGVDADARTVNQYWSTWRKGETKEVAALVSKNQTVHNVQKIDVVGESSMYSFGASYIFRK